MWARSRIKDEVRFTGYAANFTFTFRFREAPGFPPGHSPRIPFRPSAGVEWMIGGGILYSVHISSSRREKNACCCFDDGIGDGFELIDFEDSAIWRESRSRSRGRNVNRYRDGGPGWTCSRAGSGCLPFLASCRACRSTVTTAPPAPADPDRSPTDKAGRQGPPRSRGWCCRGRTGVPVRPRRNVCCRLRGFACLNSVLRRMDEPGLRSTPSSCDRKAHCPVSLKHCCIPPPDR